MNCLSVVMPCYNEAGTIGVITARVLASPYTAELIIVDDGSTDGTLESARRITDPRVRVIAQTSNQGKGAALRRGLAAATAPYVIVQDADLEYDPEDFGRMIGPLLDGRADVVYGNRFDGTRPHRVLYFWHAVGNSVLTTASNMFTNLNLADMETCYKAFRREVIQSFVIEEDRFGFEPEITAKVARGGWRIYEVGIAYAGRTYAEGKKVGWKDGVRATYCIVRYSGAVNRLRPRLSRGARRHSMPVPLGEAEVEPQGTLHSLGGAHEYTEWIYSLVAPHVGHEVLEIGAGHGVFTERLAQASHVTATDASDSRVSELQQRYEGDSRVDVLRADLSEATSGAAYDSIVLIDVLEHIADDVLAAKQLAAALKPDGRLVLWLPPLPQLYGDFERSIGNRRRYTVGQLRRMLSDADLDMIDIRYVNLFGRLAWWVVAKKLHRAPTTSTVVRLFDRALVPLLRRAEPGRRPPFGQPAFCVARRR